MLQKLLFITLLLVGFNAFALKQESGNLAPPGVDVYIISPADGDIVSQTFRVRFGLRGMGIAPAGIDRVKTAHHHLLIDTKVLPNLTKPLQATAKVRHFGGGQKETQLTLKPGQHTLQLLLGNYAHVP